MKFSMTVIFPLKLFCSLLQNNWTVINQFAVVFIRTILTIIEVSWSWLGQALLPGVQILSLNLACSKKKPELEKMSSNMETRQQTPRI